MVPSPTRLPRDSEARHSAGWYGSVLQGGHVRAGDRIFVQCERGPCTSRLETFPPRLEIEEKGGLYVLLDQRPIDDWKYQFLPNDY
jgi:MOSC domain-containing protein YiiM